METLIEAIRVAVLAADGAARRGTSSGGGGHAEVTTTPRLEKRTRNDGYTAP